jgi:hypothetical protein
MELKKIQDALHPGYVIVKAAHADDLPKLDDQKIDAWSKHVRACKAAGEPFLTYEEWVVRHAGLSQFANGEAAGQPAQAVDARPAVEGELSEGDTVRALDVDWSADEDYAHKVGTVERLDPDGMMGSVEVVFADGSGVICRPHQLTKIAASPAAAPEVAHAEACEHCNSKRPLHDLDCPVADSAHAQQGAATSEPIAELEVGISYHKIYAHRDVVADLPIGEYQLYLAPAAVAPSDATGKAVPPMPKRWQDRRDEYPKYEQPCADFLIEQEMKEWREWGAKVAESATGKADAANAGELPPLPQPLAHVDAWVTRDYGRKTGSEELEANGEYFDADQMRAYGSACIAATSAADAKDAERYREVRQRAYRYGVGNPTAEQLDADVDAALAHITGKTLFGLPVVIDDSVPPGQARFTSGRRTVVADVAPCPNGCTDPAKGGGGCMEPAFGSCGMDAGSQVHPDSALPSMRMDDAAWLAALNRKP